MQLTFANKDTCKEFISKTHKQLMHIDIKEKPNQVVEQDLNGHSCKEDIEMAMKHIKDAQHLLVLLLLSHFSRV